MTTSSHVAGMCVCVCVCEETWNRNKLQLRVKNSQQPITTNPEIPSCPAEFAGCNHLIAAAAMVFILKNSVVLVRKRTIPTE
jgi:hypothetical protein